MRTRAFACAVRGGLSLPDSADVWALYVAHAVRFLSAHGRLAFVLPSSLLQADYANPIRKFLLERFQSITVVTLEQTGFPGALVDIVLLLASNDGPPGLNLSGWDGMDSLTRLRTLRVNVPRSVWNGYRQPETARRLVDAISTSGLTPLSEITEIRIGVVTGANHYFVLSASEARARAFGRGDLRRMIVGPSAIRGIRFGSDDMQELDRRDAPSKLVWLPKTAAATGRSEITRYIARGRRLGIHHRTKTSERDPWYFVDDWRVPDLFLPYMSHSTIRCAVNDLRCSSTNLIHHLNIRGGQSISAAALAVSLQSSVAQLSAEAVARSYGGGVLKLEPSDVGKLLIPPLDGGVGKVLAAELAAVDAMVRGGESDLARQLVDRILVKSGVLSRTVSRSAHEALGAVRSGRLQRGRLQRRLARSLVN